MAIEINIPTDIHDEVAQSLMQAIRAADEYDGKENSSDKLLKHLADFEAYAELLTENTRYHRDVLARESIIAAKLINSDKPVTAGALLDEAIANFGKRFAANELEVEIIDTGFHFIPTEPNHAPIIGSGTGWNVEFDNRLEKFMRALNLRGIFVDDVVIYRGIVPAQTMRERSYNIIQIPRLNCEVAICDQVGEAAFVSHGLKGPLFWATQGKMQLQTNDSITRVVHNHGWEAEIIDLLHRDNVPGDKIKVTALRDRGYPLTEEIIIYKALDYARANGGKLPGVTSGEVQGLPGQRWTNWDLSLAKGYRGLSREGMSLSKLFEVYGLCTNGVENPGVISNALKQIDETGKHGLLPDALDLGQVLEDFILVKGLEYAEQHGKLPTEDSGNVSRTPGQTWNSYSIALRQKLRLLKRDDMSLSKLFQLYGLKHGKKDDMDAIRAAIETVRRTGHHGLSPVKIDRILTEDFILTKALEYAEKRENQLPGVSSGEIEGLPGQTWAQWDVNLKQKLRGLMRDGVSLLKLFQLYGLKTGKSNNHEMITAAIQRMKETGHHGLRALNQSSQSLDPLENKL